MHIIAIILQVLLAVLFVMSGFMKFGAKQQVEEFKRFGFSDGFRVFTGLVEIVGAVAMVVGIWYPLIATLAGLWLGVTMLVAAITHLRAKDPAKHTMPAIILLILAVLVSVLHWIG